MIKRLKAFTVNVVAGANVVSAILMWLVGYSDRINPTDHPMLACVGLAFPVFLAINVAFLVFWIVVKWRMAVLPVAALLVAYAPIRTYMPLNRGGDTPSGAIKVLSYNVRWFSNMDSEADTNAIVDYIKSSGADIVCLQEAVEGTRDVVGMLKQKYPYSDMTKVGAKQESTLALFTRYPIIRTQHIDYVSDGNGSMAYYLKVGADTVLVVNNHFESNRLSDDEKARYKEMLKGEMEQDTAREESRRLLHKLADAAKRRAPQADSVHAFIAANDHYPIILCGDFNDNPISYTRHTVAKGLVDCYISTGTGIGMSYNQKGFFVRIDNIMCSEHFVPYNCNVDNKIKASDHYPIYCWLKKRTLENENE